MYKINNYIVLTFFNIIQYIQFCFCMETAEMAVYQGCFVHVLVNGECIALTPHTYGVSQCFTNQEKKYK